MERKTRRLLGTLGMVVGTTTLVVGVIPTYAGATHEDANPKTTELKDEQRWTRFDDPSFDDEDCGGLDPADGPVWHFIANQLPEGTQTVSFSASFGPTDGGAATETISDVASARKENNNSFQYYVQGNTQPYLVNAVATFNIDQPSDNVLVLSHICGGTTATTTTSTTSSTTSSTTTSSTTTTTHPTTTTTHPTTTTTAPTTTTTTAPTTTTTAPTTTSIPLVIITTTTTAPTTTTEDTAVLPTSIVPTTEEVEASTATTAAATEVRGNVLARTGNETRPLLLVAGLFILMGGAVIYGSSRLNGA